MKKIIFGFLLILAYQVNAQMQSDESDAVWSIVVPEAASLDIDMGQALVGEFRDSVITGYLRNAGQWPVRIDSIVIEGQDAAQFRHIGGIPPFTIDVNQEKNCEFSFMPADVGAKSAEIVIYTQADTLRQSITGEGVEPRLEVFSGLIDFGTIDVGDSKDTVQTLLTNLSSDPIEISATEMLGPDTEQFSILSGGGAFTLAPKATRELELEFRPRYIGRTSGQIGFYYEGVGSPAVAQLFGAGMGGQVYVADDSAYAGEQRMLRVILGKGRTEKLQELVASFSGVLRVQQSILAPADPANFLKIRNDTTYISFSGQIDGTTDVLANIPVIAGLGSVETTSVDIEEFKWHDAAGLEVEYDTETGSGQFTLLGICPEGGDRLLNPEGTVLLSIIPNPTNGSADVEINLLESGRTQLFVMNLLGECVLNLLDGEAQAGRQSISLDCSGLSSGIYQVILQTPTIVKTRRLELVK